MLGHRQTRSGDYQCRRGRYIEGLRCTRTGARGIDKMFMTATDPSRMCAHALGQAGKFLNSFTFSLKRDERGRNLRVSCAAVKQPVEKLRSFRARKILITHQARQKVVGFGTSHQELRVEKRFV